MISNFSSILQDGKRRYQEAVARKKIRLDRFVCFVLSVAYWG